MLDCFALNIEPWTLGVCSNLLGRGDCWPRRNLFILSCRPECPAVAGSLFSTPQRFNISTSQPLVSAFPLSAFQFFPRTPQLPCRAVVRRLRDEGGSTSQLLPSGCTVVTIVLYVLMNIITRISRFRRGRRRNRAEQLQLDLSPKKRRYLSSSHPNVGGAYVPRPFGFENIKLRTPKHGPQCNTR